MSKNSRQHAHERDDRTPGEGFTPGRGRQGSDREGSDPDDAGLEHRLVERLRGAVGSGPSGCALGGTVRVGVRDGRVQLRAANRFGADLAERRYLPIVRDELGRSDAEVEIVIDPSVADHRRGPGRGADGVRTGSVTDNGASARGRAGVRELAPAHAAGGASGGERPSGAGVGNGRAAGANGGSRASARRFYRFEDFVVGPSNRLAYNAAVSLACEDDALVSTRLLVLHGPCGVGKTHLLRALSCAYASRRGEPSVRTVTAEGFTNEYVESVRTGKIEAFRKRYRSIGLLCIDDVHFVAAKPGTQSELMHTLDQLGLRGSRVVLVSDEHPRLIKQLSAPLRSRFSSGAVVGIDSPDDELCRALTERFARERGMGFAGPAVDAIVSRARAESGSGSGDFGAREL